MIKNKLFRTVISLIGLGFIAKLLSTLAKIITIRILKTEAMGVYTLASSSLILLITLSQLGLSTTISRMIATSPNKRRKIISTALVIVTFTTITLCLTILFGAKYFSHNVLKNDDTLLSLYALIPFIPLVGYGMIIKAYYIGINKIEITGYAQVTEEVIRILFLLIACSYFNKFGIKYGSMAAILSLSIAEVGSVLHMLLYSKKKIKRNTNLIIKDFKTPKQYLIKEMLPISLSMTAGRLISSITFFVEPIILTNILLNLGYTSKQISIEYALLTSYAMPLLLLPGFFSMAFSNIILPLVSKDISEGNYKHAQYVSKTLTFYSTIVGLFFSIICFFFPEFLMKLLYGSSDGYHYVKLVSFPFILYYIQAPLSSILIALNKEKSALRDSLIGSIVRVSLLTLTIPYLKINGVILATISGVAIVTILHLITIWRHLFLKPHKDHLFHKCKEISS